ncbi:hypothetical protein TRICI_005353 [Trichomonascus ciferrii]|uniref:CID domain-containing protein n=1 Tax=Trichomonascus ciferrii TaxID=44093 RepID=A0A642UV58_9ASCO|nr:hypothetical protein TRICI_005353 [Trichomonascus ciferrii]
MSADSPVDEFSNTLQSLLNVKAPGVSGSKIKQLTQIASENVQSESVIIQKLFTHFKKTPASHKLGALYVVDSIVRRYQDQAKKNEETIGPDAPEGTPAAAVYRVSELVDGLMSDICSAGLPKDQLDKTRKLLDIWDRAGTFPKSTLDAIRKDYFKIERSTTPPGSPPVHVLTSTSIPPAPKPAIVEASPPPPPPPQSQPEQPNANGNEYGNGSEGTESAENKEKPAVPDTASILQALASIAKQKPSGGENDNTNSNNNNNGNGGGAAIPQAQAPNPEQLLKLFSQQSDNGRERTPPKHERRRSQSPPRRDQRSPSRRSRSPIGGGGGRRAGSHEFENTIANDPNIPPGTVKVLSRTLFVGGIPPHMNENDVSAVFKKFARVQSIVFHKEKKHAFVKTFTRREAEISKEQFEAMNRSGKLNLRARWGVGFGPRDCCDYQKGISVIPISRLTEADTKWIQSAEVGGTNGKPLTDGLVVEEPDIEIGSGVSSKAISRRMPTNSSKNGPRSTKENDGSRGGGGNRRNGNEWPKSNSASQSPPPPFPGMPPSANGAMPPELASFLSSMVQQNTAGGNAMPQGFPMPPPQQGSNDSGQFPQFPFNPQMAAAFFQQQQQNQQQNPQNQNFQR